MAFPESTGFPPALIWGFVLFLALKEPIQSDTIIIATLGGEANFHCNFSLLMDILQVTWQQRNGTSFQPHGLRLIESFQKKVLFTRGSKASAVTLQNLTLEADSYYRCIFNVFHHGSFSIEICLNIQSKFSTNSFSLSGTQFGSDELRRWRCHYTIQHMEIFHAAACPWWIVSRLSYWNYYLTNCPFNSTIYDRNINLFAILFPRQKTQCTQNSCKGDRLLQQDLGERASVSLHTLEDQHITYQNEVTQTPKASNDYSHSPLGISVCPAMSLLHGTVTLGR
ncbi:uncharacterized protein LOC107212077 [Parus major]|uniref:uncharacterized protein LOC107212077 n=1 Tax=Parus major TaxID=9157 RepID=UPI001444964C|nr:uncharacterized protein LOC107212077 [Parus major]